MEKKLSQITRFLHKIPSLQANIIFTLFPNLSFAQWNNSNEEQVHLEKLDFDAAGKYYCEVSTDTPIFTKESNVEQLHVIGECKIFLIFLFSGFFFVCRIDRLNV